MRHDAMPRSSGWYSPSPPCSKQHVLLRRRVPTHRLDVSRNIGCAHDEQPQVATLVLRMSLREVSGLSSVSMPAAASSGSVSSKIRPLESARVITVESAKKRFYRKQREDREGKLIFHDVPKIPDGSSRFSALFAVQGTRLMRAPSCGELLLDALVAAIE